MYESDIGPERPDTYRDSADVTPSIYRIVRILAEYRAFLGLGLLAVAGGYILVAAVLLLRAPSQRVVALPFRLEFSGASEGTYPNGLKFSSGDIVAAPIVTAVYQRNRLDRFLSPGAFTRSLVVIESNQALEQLTADYRSRLADPRLSPVDRERLTAEFRQKSASLSKGDWALTLVVPDKSGTIPDVVAKKVLQDVLTLWAEDTAIKRKALQFRVPTLTANVFREDASSEELVISLMRLRSRVLDVTENIARLSSLPGAELMRTQKSNMSLAEIDLLLGDLLRVDVEPLIARAIRSGTIQNPAATLGVLEAQREYDKRQLALATQRAEILRMALTDYISEGRATAPEGRARVERSWAEKQPAQATDAVITQIDDSFLDRLVRMANESTDRQYRQAIVNEIRAAALATLPLQNSVSFDDQIIELARSARLGAGVNEETAAALRTDYAAVRRRAIEAVTEVNEIYRLLSRNLEPTTQLFTVTAPPNARIERTLSTKRLALGGLIAFLIAIPVLAVGALIHHRFVREKEEAHEREDAVTQV